jgi:hypothetical protein
MPDTLAAPASTAPAIPAAVGISAPNAEWASPHNLVAGTALSNLQGLGDGTHWKSLLGGALPGALLAGGTAWLGHRLLAGKGDTPEEQERKKWQRRLMALGGGLAGAYGGANAKWKYEVAPELRQGLAKSWWDPRGAFAAGMDANYKPNVARGSQAIQKSQPFLQRAVDWVADRYYIPGMGSLPAWLSPIGTVADGISSAGAARHYRRDGSRSVEDSPGVDAFTRMWDEIGHDRTRSALLQADDSAGAAALREQLQQYRASLGLES